MLPTARAVRCDGDEATGFGGARGVALGKYTRKRSNLGKVRSSNLSEQRCLRKGFDIHKSEARPHNRDL